MAVTFNLHIGLPGWSSVITYVVGNRFTAGGNAYQCTVGGNSTAAPTGTGSAINNGGAAVFKWLSAADFTTLAAAVAALPATFTQPITWAFWNNGTISIPGANVPYLTLSGHTTTPTNNLTLTCAPGEGIRDALHGGHTALAFSAAAGVSFTLPTANPGFHVDFFDVSDDFVAFDGLQFQNPNATNGCSILATEPAATSFIARNCIFDYSAQTGMTQLGFYAPGYTVSNCLFVDHQPIAGGQIGIKAEAVGTFVNCTAIAPNSPAGTVLIVSDVATVGVDPFPTDFTTDFGPIGPVTVRNCACFGYVGGIAASVAIAGAVIIDHCATSATSIGSNNTDAGSNLLNQVAATNLVSLASDARLLLGAALLNVGATDTADIPSGDDIARTIRPQGVAWDIGAFEFLPLRLRGVGSAAGRSLLGHLLSNRGTAQSRARSVLTVTATATIWTGRARSMAFGTAAGQYVQSTQVADPWDAAFSSDWGPFAVPFQGIVGTGSARATARASVSISLALSTSGQATSRARVGISAVALVVSRSRSTVSGRAGETVSRPLLAAGSSQIKAQSTGLYRDSLSSAGLSKAIGVAVGGLRALVNARGNATARGKSVPPPAAAVLRALGRARLTAASVGLYTTPATANRGRAASRAKAILTPSVALHALGTAATVGNLLYAENALILGVSGASQSSATAAAMDLATAPVAAGSTQTSGQTQINILQPVSAAGMSQARALAILLLSGLLPSRGMTASNGRLITPVLTAAPRARGTAIGKARSLVKMTTALLALSFSTARARSTTSGSVPILARGAGQGSGQIGANTQRHLQASGKSVAIGMAASANRLDMSSRGTTRTSAATAPLYGRQLKASGSSYITARSVVSGLSKLRARGLTQVFGAVASDLQADLAAVSVTTTSAVAQVALMAGLTSLGAAILSGAASADMTVALTASGSSVSTAQAGSLGFVPVALVATGRAGTFASARPSAGLRLTTTSVGFSAGRCASIQTVLLIASGRTHASGRMAAISAVGLIARGATRASGRLFNRHIIDGLGQAVSHGHGLLAGAFNVTPDTPGPGLSTLGLLPAFDAMDLSDVDFFSFDWSGRASVLGDPIVSASVTAAPLGMAVGPVVVAGSIVQVRVAAGTLVETFSLRCSVTLRSGRILHWSAPVSVADF